MMNGTGPFAGLERYLEQACSANPVLAKHIKPEKPGLYILFWLRFVADHGPKLVVWLIANKFAPVAKVLLDRLTKSGMPPLPADPEVEL